MPGGHELAIGAQRVFARGTAGANGQLHAQLGERRVNATVVITGERRHVFFEGRAWPLALVNTLHVGGAGDEVEGGLKAPMPGVIRAVAVNSGDSVTKGQLLVVLEAMKMEHRIVAPQDGVVHDTKVAVGEQVGNGQLLLTLAAKEEAG